MAQPKVLIDAYIDALNRVPAPLWKDDVPLVKALTSSLRLRDSIISTFMPHETEILRAKSELVRGLVGFGYGLIWKYIMESPGIAGTTQQILSLVKIKPFLANKFKNHRSSLT